MEANTEQRKWFVPCCKDEDCHLCKGTGKYHPERCPIYYYKGELKKLRYLYELYEYKKILPFECSPLKQPKVLFTTFELINYYLNMFRKLKSDQMNETSDLASRIMEGKNG